MDVVTGATSSLLPKLGALLQDEYRLQKKVKKDVESIQKELIFMRAALYKVAEVPPERLDQQVKAWASNVRELSYDMEDAADTFKVRVLVGGRLADPDNIWAINVLEMINKGLARRELANVIQEMKTLTLQVAELRDRYKLDDLASSIPVATTTKDAHPQGVSVRRESQSAGIWWSQLVSNIISVIQIDGGFVKWLLIDPQEVTVRRQPAVVPARKKTSDELAAWLVDSATGGPSGYVRYIVGVPGVGKSHLARALFRRYGGHFDRRAIVTVPPGTDDVPCILRMIASQVLPLQDSSAAAIATSQRKGFRAKVNRIILGPYRSQKLASRSYRNVDSGVRDAGSSGDEEKYLTDKLKEYLKEYSFLVIIDDVRCEKMWEQIRGLLDKIGKTRKIIVTTRFEAVAVTACEKEARKNMEALDLKDSKEMFMRALSEPICGCKDGGQELARNVPPRLWEMCRDQPLAIAMLAGLVACNPNMSEEGWKQVCSKMVPESRKALTLDGVQSVLSHCYNDMPAEIKTCCLYLSMYPKGCNKISRKNLIRRWISEGFVTGKNGISVEDVAEEYFNHLIKRKMIQTLVPSSNWKVKNCQVYDLVHEFIVSKAREENLVTVVGGYWYMPPANGRVRRLSLSHQGSEHKNVMETMNLSHVRSLAVSGDPKRLLHNPLQSPIIQVLDLEGCKYIIDKKDMKAICRMLLLKYLSLRGTGIQELHEDIGKLKYLETLDVRETQVRSLPDEACQLQCLVSILGGDKRGKWDKRPRVALKLAKKMKFEKMQSLRVLSGIEITEDSRAFKDLESLTCLRKLAIYRLIILSKDGEDYLSASIKTLCTNSLQTLVIIQEEEAPIMLSESNVFPSSARSLTSLELSGRWDPTAQKISEFSALTKLSLPITALKAEALNSIGRLSALLSLTFSAILQEEQVTAGGEISDAQQDQNAEFDGELYFKAGLFENLKLLRFFAPSVPQLSFLSKALPKLEEFRLRFCSLVGIYGLENLEALQEVYLGMHDDADEYTKAIVRNIAAGSSNDVVRIIRESY